MLFRFSKARSRDNLLIKYSEEEIMEAMGVPITEERFCSPFRQDDHPTCSLWRAPGNGQLYFMDWATLGEPVDVFGLYMYAYGGNFNEAVHNLWSLMEGSSSGKTPPPAMVNNIRVKELSQTMVKASQRKWLATDYAWWNKFGIEPKTLERYNVVPAQYVWLGEDLIYQFSSPAIYPAYIYTFPSDSIKVYFPFRKRYRFYHNNASTLQGYSQLPYAGRLLAITKSLKDVLCLHKYGIPAVAPQSESILVPGQQLNELKDRFRNVVVFYDNDLAGRIALRKYKKLGFKIFMLSRHWAKDISDFYAKYGAERTGELISKTKEELLSSNSSIYNRDVTVS